MGLIAESYFFMQGAHGEHVRMSGRPYTVHPEAVWTIYQWLRPDDKVGQSACLAHDVLEDSLVTLKEVRSCLGQEVASMVKALTKKPRGEFRCREERTTEYHNRLFSAARKDRRIALIKLCDRLDNLRTIDALGKKKAFRILKETEEVMLPFFGSFNLLLTAEVVSLCRWKRLQLNGGNWCSDLSPRSSKNQAI